MSVISFMSSLARIFSCMVAAWVFGCGGLLVWAIFGPLLFPLSLPDPSRTENTVVFLGFAVGLIFAAAGVAFCWRITGRWASK